MSGCCSSNSSSIFIFWGSSIFWRRRHGIVLWLWHLVLGGRLNLQDLKIMDKKDQRLDNAGPGKWRTEWQGWKMQFLHCPGLAFSVAPCSSTELMSSSPRGYACSMYDTTIFVRLYQDSRQCHTFASKPLYKFSCFVLDFISKEHRCQLGLQVGLGYAVAYTLVCTSTFFAVFTDCSILLLVAVARQNWIPAVQNSRCHLPGRDAFHAMADLTV